MKLQRLQQGSMSVDEYYKLMESMLLKVGLEFESEEEKVARFVSAFRRDIQDLVELYEYSYLDKVMSSNFCPHLIFKFGDLIEFSVLKD